MTCWWENGNYQNCCILHRQQKRVGEMTCEYQKQHKRPCNQTHLFFTQLFSFFLFTMSDIVVPGFASSELIAALAKIFDEYTPEERAKFIKQVCTYITIRSLFVKDDLYRCCPRSTVSSNLISRTRKARLRPSSLTQRRKARSPVVRVPRLMPP